MYCSFGRSSPIATLVANRPALESKQCDLPGHQQSNYTHCDGVHEHCIESIMDQTLNCVIALMASQLS